MSPMLKTCLAVDNKRPATNAAWDGATEQLLTGGRFGTTNGGSGDQFEAIERSSNVASDAARLFREALATKSPSGMGNGWEPS